MKKKKIFALITTILLAAITLSACSNHKQTSQSLPSSQVILSKAQNTKFSSMHATWLQTDATNQTLQKAEARYQKKPLVIYANFRTNDNHYKMWLNRKHNFVQMQGTSSKRWFKTKLGKSSAYAQLTDVLAQSALMSFDNKCAKKFKVARIPNGYSLNYDGQDKHIWNFIIQNTMITSVIGIDPDNLKPDQVKIQIETDQKYQLTKLDINAGYRENGKLKHMRMVINQINQLPKMQIPSNVTRSAVDLGSLSR